MQQFKRIGLARHFWLSPSALAGYFGPALRRSGWLFTVIVLAGTGAQGQFTQGTTNQVDCTDPLYSSSAACGSNQVPIASQTNLSTPASSVNTTGNTPTRNADTQQVYSDQAGLTQRRTTTTSNRPADLFPPEPLTDFQRLARASTGQQLPIFGRDLFQRAPSTFAPADQIPVTADYVVGPGDEVLVRLWGPETLNSQLTVDTAGSIYIPKVGAIHVAGLRFEDLQRTISTEVNRVYRNYKISVSLGHLRSIQVYVVGEARRPGAYTISSLSTVLNALFASGGPNAQGSLRRIQVRRTGQTLPEFDLYDLVLSGDQSKDIRLQSGDTIFIPPVGPQAALAGSIRHPAIYELKEKSTVEDLLTLAGGFSAVGITTDLRLERIESDHTRQAMNITLNSMGRDTLLHDGDVLYTEHISNAYQKSVTIRGNLANPGRFAWREGMRLSDIIPDRRSLLTSDYWRERNLLGVPTPLFEPGNQRVPLDRDGLPMNVRRDQSLYGSADAQTNQNQYSEGSGGDRSAAADASDTNGYGNGTFGSDVYGSNPSLIALGAAAAADSVARQGSDTGNSANGLGSQNGGNRTNSSALPLPLSTQTPGDNGQLRPKNQIRIPAPEIDWSYAVIERLDPETLKSTLVPFNLGKLVGEHDANQNLELQPGDVVTILSQNDIGVPIDAQTKYVRLEGEFVSAGVYSVQPGETLEELVQRSGGFTPKAYLYGSNFTRDSARIFQQQRLDEYISTLSTDLERAAAVRAASSTTGILDPNSLNEQRTLVSQLRAMRATGRVVLEFQPDSNGLASVPRIPLENGDVFRVPSKPNTVSVVGAVYGQNVYLYNADRRLDDYIALAGEPNRVADRKHAFIIRADGSVYSRERAQGVFSNHFDSARINPGDAIVIPEKLIKPTALRTLLDYSQILSSFGLAAAAINVVR